MNIRFQLTLMFVIFWIRLYRISISYQLQYNSFLKNLRRKYLYSQKNKCGTSFNIYRTCTSSHTLINKFSFETRTFSIRQYMFYHFHLKQKLCALRYVSHETKFCILAFQENRHNKWNSKDRYINLILRLIQTRSIHSLILIFNIYYLINCSYFVVIIQYFLN